jgi:Flp pilus assembly protein TadG
MMNDTSEFGAIEQSRLRRIIGRLTSDTGSQLVELAMVTPILVLLLVGAVDFGRGFYVMMEVSAAAESGALYGIQNPADVAGMQAAAQLDAPDLPSLAPVATSGMECSDGTSAVSLQAATPTCGVTVVQFVEVDTTATYKTILNYPGIPSTFTLGSKARMRASI